MTTTMLRTWSGRVEVNVKTIATVTDWYCLAQGDADKASEIENQWYWQGVADAFADVLDLLHVDTASAEAATPT